MLFSGKLQAIRCPVALSTLMLEELKKPCANQQANN
jgi:hypothetical protein